MLRVLSYHRIGANAEDRLDPGLLSATWQALDQQIEYLRSHFEFPHIDDVLSAFRKRHALPKSSVLLTFDDGYRDFAEYAWPVLRSHGVPAVLFVATAYASEPSQRFWWDRLQAAVMKTPLTHIATTLGEWPLSTPQKRCHALRALKALVKQQSHERGMRLVDEICRTAGIDNKALPAVLNWQELRQLASEGVTIGAHTRTHPLLTKITPQQAWLEISGAQDDLRREIGTALPVFCYPAGAYDESVLRLARKAGIELAFTTEEGENYPERTDSLRLKRTDITTRTTLPVFRIRLHRIGTFFDLWRGSPGGRKAVSLLKALIP